MLGVVGADIAVRRLEREVILEFLASDEPLALVNGDGRVVVSGEASVCPGSLVLDAPAWVVCSGTPLRVVSVGR